MTNAYVVIDNEHFTPIEGCKIVLLKNGHTPRNAQDALNKADFTLDLEGFVAGSEYQGQPGSIKRSWSGTRPLQPA